MQQFAMHVVNVNFLFHLSFSSSERKFIHQKWCCTFHDTWSYCFSAISLEIW